MGAGSGGWNGDELQTDDAESARVGRAHHQAELPREDRFVRRSIKRGLRLRGRLRFTGEMMGMEPVDTPN